MKTAKEMFDFYKKISLEKAIQIPGLLNILA